MASPFSAWLFSSFASIAQCLTGFGIYGVVAYATRSRKRDYGICLALGADAVALFGLAVRESLTPVLIGAALGAAGTFWTSRLIAAVLYKTSPYDTAACLVSGAVLLSLAFAATFVPALRICRIDPAATLRGE